MGLKELLFLATSLNVFCEQDASSKNSPVGFLQRTYSSNRTQGLISGIPSSWQRMVFTIDGDQKWPFITSTVAIKTDRVLSHISTYRPLYFSVLKIN